MSHLTQNRSFRRRSPKGEPLGIVRAGFIG